MKFDRVALVLLLMLAAARLLPHPQHIFEAVAMAFLARITLSVRNASFVHLRRATVSAAGTAQVVRLQITDAA